MLYKKVHRQFLREFKKGRKFKVGDDVFKSYWKTIYKRWLYF